MFRKLAVLVGCAVTALGCLANPGGANRGAHAPGSGDAGIKLSGLAMDIAVSEDGTFAVYEDRENLAVLDLRTSGTRTYPAVTQPRLVAFLPKTSTVFVVSGQKGSKNHPEETLLSLDLETGQVIWQFTLQRLDHGLLVASDGSRLVLWGRDAILLEPSTGKLLATIEASEPIADVDLHAATGRLILTEATALRPTDGSSQGSQEVAPSTLIQVHNLADGNMVCSLRLANCADELVLSPDGSRGYLAPTFCGRDPVTVIDVPSCKSLTTLPGFGPVAVMDSGRLAVAFLDKETQDPLAPALPKDVQSSTARFHLMLLQTESLTYRTIPFGSQLPRYAVLPDQHQVLLDSAFRKLQLQLMKVDATSYETIKGPAIPLGNFVSTPDSSHLYLVSDGLYHLDVKSLRIDSLPLSFLPRAINITPDGATVLLRDNAGKIHLFDTKTGDITKSLP